MAQPQRLVKGVKLRMRPPGWFKAQQKAAAQARARLKEAPGRPMGKPEGSWIHELLSRRTCVLLCWKCQPKFNEKAHNYYRDRRFPYVVGNCDGCRSIAPQAALYIHEGYLTNTGGRTVSGQSWLPA